MKKILFTLSLFIGTSAAFAQNYKLDNMTKEELKVTCEGLINVTNDLLIQLQETDSCKYAHEKYLFCEAVNGGEQVSVKSPWSFIDFKVLSAEGDRAEQTVTVELLLTNSALNQQINIERFSSRAIDAIGNSSVLNTINEGSGNYVETLYTDVPIKVKLTFVGVMPGTELFSHIGFSMSTRNDSGGALEKGKVEIRNVLVQW